MHDLDYSMSDCGSSMDAALSLALLEVEYLKLQVAVMAPAALDDPIRRDLSPLGR